MARVQTSQDNHCLKTRPTRVHKCRASPYPTLQFSRIQRALQTLTSFKSHSNALPNCQKVRVLSPSRVLGLNSPACTDIEWKLIYVGSAESSSYDQELDSCMVGPVPVGVNSFEFEVGTAFFFSLCFYLCGWTVKDGASLSIMLARGLSFHIYMLLLHTMTHATISLINRHLLLHLQQSNQTT